MVFGLESLAQIVDSSVDGVAALNQAGRIIYANLAVGDVLGVSPESIIGTEFVTYIIREDRPQLGPYFADISHRHALASSRCEGCVRTATCAIWRSRIP